MIVKTCPIVAVLFLLGMPIFAEEIESPQIMVYGTAVTMIVPDEMTWNLTVKNIGSELKDVAERHNKIVKKTLQILREEKVKEEEIKTARMEFGENRQYKDGSNVKEGYFASSGIDFKIKDFEKYRSLWISLSEIEGVSVNRINYGSSKRIEYQNETMKKALLAAKDKALMLAQTIRAGIGKALIIEEMESYSGPSPYNTVSVQTNDVYSGEDFVPGKIPVQVRVKAVFELTAF